MTAYIFRRLLLVIPTLLGIMIINFAVVQIVPGGPVEQMISKIKGHNIDSTARIAELMGMLPVQVEAAELSQALATGVAESFVSSGSTGYDRKVWEHLSHFYEVNAWLPRNYVMVNKKSWNKLDKNTQNIIMGVAQMAEAAGTARSEQLSGWYLTQLAANGMKVQVAEGQLRADLERIGKTMSDEWMKNAGPIGKKIIDGFRSE